ncbi:hypothetical protein ZHAS_00015873 [Anopheles sinensis]|uniref:BEN domain-containing protein n=1 Tax=Anopheles sinensis TaxID=74873 RepID=A0A084WC55_ANOSI|nr:hypothetical protein ZHAS_00015873 [Anopheles sinensis]
MEANSGSAATCNMPSYGNGMRTVSYSNASPNTASTCPPGGVSLQRNRTSSQTMNGSDNGCDSRTSTSQPDGAAMERTRYNTRQQVPVKSNAGAPTARLPRVASTLWVLIEWVRPNGKRNIYTVIPSTQIVERVPDDGGHDTAKDSNYYTGKFIHVQCGERELPATIVMVSEDKKFIDTELRQLRNMTVHNTKAIQKMQPTGRAPPFGVDQDQSQQHLSSTKQTNETDRVVQFPERKQRVTMQSQVENQETLPANKRFRTDSSCSVPDRISISPSSIERSTVGTDNRAVTPGDRMITPRSDRMAPSNHVVPMTFDQQTQTVGLSTVGSGTEVQLDKILSYLESVLAEQKSSRMEREYDRKLLLDLHEKLTAQETLLRGIEEKISGTGNRQPGEDNTPGYVEEVELIDRCAMADELHGDGFVDTSMVLTDANGDHNWMPPGDVPKKNESRLPERNGDRNGYVVLVSTETSSSESGKINNHNDTPSLPAVPQKVLPNEISQTIDELKDEWDDTSGDDQSLLPPATTNSSNSPNERQQGMVAIGAHGTRIKQDALQMINWSNFKSATRKLLMEVFGREKLATHSLSGRPSPAMRSNTEKPIKDRLEANMVADVIEIVTKMCNVDECLIRNVITAKCADECRMRNRRAKMIETALLSSAKLEQTENVLAVLADNKENIR